jgi:hypothetical protein
MKTYKKFKDHVSEVWLWCLIYLLDKYEYFKDSRFSLIYQWYIAWY